MRRKKKTTNGERGADEGRRVQERLEQLERYVDHEKFFTARTATDLPNMFQVVIDGKVCCAVGVNWDAIREVARDTLRRDFESLGKKVPVLATVAEDGDRLRPIDYELLAYVPPLLPEKFDVAMGQIITEALLSISATRANTLEPDLNLTLTKFAGNIWKRETQDIKNRLGIRRGTRKGSKKSATAKFSNRTFQAALSEAIRELDASSDTFPTRESVARRLGVGSAKTLDRLIRQHMPGRSWRELVAGL